MEAAAETIDARRRAERTEREADLIAHAQQLPETDEFVRRFDAVFFHPVTQ